MSHPDSFLKLVIFINDIYIIFKPSRNIFCLATYLLSVVFKYFRFAKYVSSNSNILYSLLLII